MAKRIPVSWGNRPSKAYLEVTVMGEILPKDVKAKHGRPVYGYFGQDGYGAKVFDDQLTPVALDVKVGTNGTVNLFVWVSYFFEEEDGPPLKKFYIPHKGKFSFDCVWQYDCTAAGQLSLFQYSLQNEGSTADVRLDQENEDEKESPPAGVPSYVRIRPKIENVFSGTGTGIEIGYGPVAVAVPGSSGGAGKSGTGTGVILYLKPLVKHTVDIGRVTAFALPAKEALDHTVFFDRDTQTEPSNEEKAKLLAWLEKVQDDAVFMEAIKRRYVRMTIAGHASETGTYQDNYAYAGKRLNYVWEQVKFVLEVEPDKLPLNRSDEDSSHQPNVKRKDRDNAYRKDRKVTIHIDKEEAYQAVQRLLKERGL